MDKNSTAIGAHKLPSTTRSIYDIQFRFSDNVTAPTNRQLKHLINEKTKSKEFFYGVEVLARSYNPNTVLDYDLFAPLMPLFTSIVWLSSEYWTAANIEEVESIKLAHKLLPYTIVLPHMSCFHLNEKRLQEFLNLNFSNVLAIRGDYYDLDQEYKYSEQLVQNIRRLRGDSITIGVAGYPEGHPESLSMEDLNNLVKKVEAGADFIITQICFSPEAVLNFIKKCRSKKVDVPILVGVFVPDSLRMLETVLRITKIKIAPEVMEEYRRLNSVGHNDFTEYAIRKAVEMIDLIFSSDVEVYGLQFFTQNKFENIKKVLNEIQKIKNIKFSKFN